MTDSSSSPQSNFTQVTSKKGRGRRGKKDVERPPPPAEPEREKINNKNNQSSDEKVSVVTCPEESEKNVAIKDSPVVKSPEDEGQDRNSTEFTFGCDDNERPDRPGTVVVKQEPKPKFRTIVIDGSNVSCLKKVCI